MKDDIWSFLAFQILIPLLIGIFSSIIATRITVRAVNPELIARRQIKYALSAAIKSHKSGSKKIGFNLKKFLHSSKEWIQYKHMLIDVINQESDINFRILPYMLLIDKKINEFTEKELEEYKLFCDVFILNLKDQFCMDFLIKTKTPKQDSQNYDSFEEQRYILNQVVEQEQSLEEEDDFDE